MRALFLGWLGLQIAMATGAEATREKEGFLGGLFKRAKESSSGTGVSGLTADELAAGVKEALGNGLQAAVTQLGRTNGFLTNVQVRIPMPEQLRTLERGLRKVGQEQLVTKFETTMNRAAEQAVPAAAEVFAQTLKGMSVTDAKDLLTSKSSTAVTEYFRDKTGAELGRKFLPIVKESTEKVGVTAGYKQMTDMVGGSRFGSLFKSSFNIDEYVTEKSLDGLFLMVAEEEKRIRENPAARTTELLEKVFGAVSGSAKKQE